MSLERRGWLKCNSWIIKSSRDRSIHAAKHFPNHEIIQTRFPLQFNKCSLSLSTIPLWFRLNFEYIVSMFHPRVTTCVFYRVVPCTCGFVLSASRIRYTRTPVFISLSLSLPVLPSLIRFLCVRTSAFVNREDRAGCN